MAWTLPTLQHLIPAEEFVWDATARAFSVRGVLTLRYVPADNVTLPRLDVIAVLSGGRGTFDFALEFARVHDDERVSSAVVSAQPLPNPVGIYHLPFYFENVPLDVPSQCEFRLFVRLVGDAAGRPVFNHQPIELSQTAVINLEGKKV